MMNSSSGDADPALEALRKLVDLTIEGNPKPRFLGCRIRNFGPIGDTTLSLSEGLNILYGKNGAGKSQVINAIAQLASITGPASKTDSLLYFQWTHPVIGEAGLTPESYEGNPWRSFEGTPRVDNAQNLGLGYEELPIWTDTFNKWAINAVMYLLFETGEHDNDVLLQRAIKDLLDIDFEDNDNDVRAQDSEETEFRLPLSPINQDLTLLFAVSGASPGEVDEYWNGAFRRHLAAMYHAATTSHCWTASGLEEDKEAAKDPREEDERLTVSPLALVLLETVVNGRFAITRKNDKLVLCLVSDVTPPGYMSELIVHANEELNVSDTHDASLIESLSNTIGEYGAPLYADWRESESPEWWEGIVWPTEVAAPRFGYVFQESILTIDDVMTNALVYACRHRQEDEEYRTLFETIRETFEPKNDLVPIQKNRQLESLINYQAEDFVVPEARECLEGICIIANTILATLLESPPRLESEFRQIYQWQSLGVTRWSATDQSGIRMPIEHLSTAQQRWVRFAIELAAIPQECPLVLVCIDEPEAGLHRRAERFLARGLREVLASRRVSAIIATHSPEFLGMRDVSLNHVRRDAHGRTVIEKLETQLSTQLDQFGIDRTDLLQLCRLFLVVEGQHDLIVLQELLGEELRHLGVELLALRGLRNLRNASDAQVVFRFTDADVMYLSDNEEHERIASIWERALRASKTEVLDILQEITQGTSKSESVFLREFAALALGFEARDRIHLAALSKGDIIEYLPVKHFVRNGVNIMSWDEVRRRWESSGTTKSLKSWMSLTYGSDFGDETIRTAARSMDDVPADVSNLLAYIQVALGEAAR